MIRKLELFALPRPLGRGEEDELKVESVVSDFNQSCLCNDTSIETQKDEVQRVSKLGRQCFHVSLCWVPDSRRTEAPLGPHPVYIFSWLKIHSL